MNIMPATGRCTSSGPRNMSRATNAGITTTVVTMTGMMTMIMVTGTMMMATIEPVTDGFADRALAGDFLFLANVPIVLIR